MDLIDLIWEIKKFGLENVFNRYYSLYPAKVVDNEDPKNRWRVKLEVPDILDDKELAEWAEPMPHAGKAAVDSSTNGSFGSFHPPKVGDYVWVIFRMGDIRHPIYFGGWWASDETPEFLSDDRKNAVFISRFGHKITVDETEDAAKINIESNKEYQIEIDETLDAEKITLKNGRTETTLVLDDTKDAEKFLIELGLSKNKLEFYDQDGSEYILLEDKNGNSWKWDLATNKWEVTFTGEKEETIEGNVIQNFSSNLTVNVTSNTEINTDGSAKFKQPQVAIGDGTIELLEQIEKLIEALGNVKPISPVGPCAPLSATADWPTVLSELAKVTTIKASF